MAASASDLCDEKKGDEFTDLHSLANIVAFSTKRMQMSAPSREGLVVTDGVDELVDRRTKIVFTDPKFNYVSYYMLCQLTATVTNGKTGVGSCTEVLGAMEAARHFLTCAHNLVDYSVRSGRVIPYTDSFIHKSRQGEKRSRIIFQANNKKYRIHPNYNGHPDCGFDIGIIPVIKGSEVETKTREIWDQKLSDDWNDVVWHYADPDSIKKGMAVELAGFPAEKEGWPYTHKGTVADVTKTKLGGHLIWYDCDATPGNSGSCVMITDEDYVKTVGAKRIGRRKVIIGVHTGHDRAENLNYGTLITPKINEWIEMGK